VPRHSSREAEGTATEPVAQLEGYLTTYLDATLRGRKGGGATDTLRVPELVGQAVHDVVGERTRRPLLISMHSGLRMSQRTVRRHMRIHLRSMADGGVALRLYNAIAA
jgi:hypothetical protein